MTFEIKKNDFDKIYISYILLVTPVSPTVLVVAEQNCKKHVILH